MRSLTSKQDAESISRYVIRRKMAEVMQLTEKGGWDDEEVAYYREVLEHLADIHAGIGK